MNSVYAKKFECRTLLKQSNTKTIMAAAIQNDWLCPITLSLMRDPVIASDGHSYERSAITHWFEQSTISPKTGAHLYSTDLIPNIALRNTIQDYLTAHPQNAAPQQTAIFKNVDVIVKRKVYTTGDKRILHITATPPAEGERQPVVLIAIVDNSGSMAETADDAAAESFGYTRMDLVKHAIRTMAATLNPNDMLAIVKYSTSAKAVIAPTLMTDAGRARVSAALDTIQPDSQTNIYEGIRQAAILASAPELAGRHIVALLLTDGISNVNPPRGILQTLTTLRVENPWSLHTFGFGYNLDSALLAGISEWGGGLFGFIPDCTMVGTVFINFIATVLATALHNGSVAGTKEMIKMGPIQYGQPRDYFVEVAADEVLGVEVEEVPVPDYAEAYRLYMNGIKSALSIAKMDPMAAVAGLVTLAKNMTEHRTIHDTLVDAMIKDITSSDPNEGQIGMAPTFFTKWGEHYMRSYLRAQQLQICMNFKDPGLQIYGGSLFHTTQAKAEEIFGALPPPIPSGQKRENRIGGGYGGGGGAYSTPLSMSVFHSQSGGCFQGDCNVKLADGSAIPIKDIQPGYSVWTTAGPANVVALVTCGSKKKSQPMSQINKLCITPWHPILQDGNWVFPGSIALYSERLISTVYNLVLDKGHIVNVEGVLCCTLGHGFKGPVIEHSFFGTSAVTDCLRSIDGWASGRPTFKNLTTVRAVNGTILTWKDDA